MFKIKVNFGRHALCAIVCGLAAPTAFAAPIHADVLPAIQACGTYEVGNNIYKGGKWNGTGIFVGPAVVGADKTPEVQLGPDYHDNYVEPVFVFQLPVLPAGAKVTGAKVSIFLKYSDPGVGFKANLTALGVGDTNAGGAEARGAVQFQQAGTLIAPAMFTSKSGKWAAVATTSIQSAKLGQYLRKHYKAGQWLVLRLTPAAKPSKDFRVYHFGAAGTQGMQPSLTITTSAVSTPGQIGGG